MEKIIIEKLAIAQLSKGHRIYGLAITGQLFFYEPAMKKWIPLKAEVGTYQEYEKYKEQKFGQDTHARESKEN